MARGGGTNTSQATQDMMYQRQEDGGEMRKRTAYLGCGRSGFQDLVAAQTQLGWCSASISRELAYFTTTTSRCNRFLAMISCPRRCGGGVPREMMMWFGGMGRCQCTCESHKLVPTNQAGKPFLSFPSRRLSTVPSNPLPLSSWLKNRIFVETML